MVAVGVTPHRIFKEAFDVDFTMTIDSRSIMSTLPEWEAKISYTVWHEKQTRHHPGGTGVENIELVEFIGEPRDEQQARELVINWAENNPEWLIEHAGHVEEAKRVEEAEHKMDEQRLQKLEREMKSHG